MFHVLKASYPGGIWTDGHQMFGPECGTNAKKFQTRIVGGRPADPDEYPWLVALIRCQSYKNTNIDLQIYL
jgi:hypothetical protein